MDNADNRARVGRWYIEWRRATAALWRPRAIALLLACAVVALILVWLWIPEYEKCRECRTRLNVLGYFMRSYRKEHGCLPPAHIVDENGTPIDSWRLLAMRDRYYDNVISGNELNTNSQDRRPTPWELRCPVHRAQDNRVFTDYVAVIGAKTMWPGSEGAVPAADGSDNDKILIIEIMNSDIYWMEPRDLTLQQVLDSVNPRERMGIGSEHRCGINYLTVGGEVRSLRRDIDRNTLRKLLVRD